MLDLLCRPFQQFAKYLHVATPDLNRRKLLELTSRKLNLGFVLEPELPSAALVRRTGYDAETLRKRLILPQNSARAGAGYALVVADPDSVNIAEFEREGIQILLCDAHQIERTWNEFLTSEAGPRAPAVCSAADNFCLAEPTLAAVVAQVAKDAAALGAREVFVGHPTEKMYEFSAHEQIFRGSLHESIYLQLFEYLRIHREMSFSGPGFSTPLRAALTRSFARPVICLALEPTIPIRTSVWQARPEEQRRDLIRIQPSDSGKPPQTAPSPVPRLDLRRVLLIDDDDRFSFILTKILESKGFAVLCARSGEQALLNLDHQVAVDVIICDVHMPTMDGATFVTKLRKRNKHLPVLMLTSDDDQLLEAELVLIGANAYVRKCEDSRVLLAWIHNLLAFQRTEVIA